MFYNSQDLLWRRKLEEQAELQQALELQSRRLMGLQLLDVKKHHRALSTGSPIQSPTQSPNLFSQNLVFSSIQNGSEVPHGIYKSQFIFINNLLSRFHFAYQNLICVGAENGSTPTSNSAALDLPTTAATTVKESIAANDENGNDKESPRNEVGDLPERLATFFHYHISQICQLFSTLILNRFLKFIAVWNITFQIVPLHLQPKEQGITWLLSQLVWPVRPLMTQIPQLLLLPLT